MMNEKKIRQLAEDFILYKTTIGYIYSTPQYYLRKYIDYVELVSTDAVFPEKNTTLKYLDSLTDARGSLYGTVCVLREFSRYLYRYGYHQSYLIPPKFIALPVPEPPYFFTQVEIKRFFDKLDQIQTLPSFKGRELVLPGLFRLLYCCGLRCKEARTLECCNVHTDELYIDIIQSKGPKSRRLFINKQLAQYLDNYDNSINSLFPDRKYYFPHGNRCYSGNIMSTNFRKFW